MADNLRDEIAIEAMKAIIQGKAFVEAHNRSVSINKCFSPSVEVVSKDAYRIADSMIARSKERKSLAEKMEKKKSLGDE